MLGAELFLPGVAAGAVAVFRCDVTHDAGGGFEAFLAVNTGLKSSGGRFSELRSAVAGW
jgi:TctA family transporter